MRPKIKGEYFDFAFLISAFFVWMMCALVLLLISSIILYEVGCTEKSLGYVSSTISFVSAAVSGAAAGRKRKNGALFTALLTASVLVVVLLTIGFLVNGSGISPSAVMSVISFSFTGCMVGVVFFSTPIHRKKRYRPQI